jgi:uncharacterized protein GlcG (DUF336 family)
MIKTTICYASLLTAIATVIVGHAQTPPQTPPPVARARAPTLALAVEAAQVAAATCTSNGYKTTVLVADSAGVPVVLLSGDGASERTQAIAARKIATLLSYEATNGDAASKAGTDADSKASMPRQGALLLKAGGDTIGVISVSGAPGADKDEVCSQAAVDKVKDRLK